VTYGGPVPPPVPAPGAPRPRAVTVAVGILLAQTALAMAAVLLTSVLPWLGVFFGPVTTVLFATFAEPDALVLAVVGTAVNAVWVVIALALWRRRGGARIALGVCGGSGVLVLLPLLYAYEPVGLAVNVLVAIGTVTAFVLVVGAPARAWYRRPSRA
jgi:hypothetical protein